MMKENLKIFSNAESRYYYFDQETDVRKLSGNLPHWRQGVKIYFVTFRLCDSLPQEKLQQLQIELVMWEKMNPKPHTKAQLKEYYSLFKDRPQVWLDSGYGSCILDIPDIGKLVSNSITHFNGVRYNLDSFVIAGNHVHVLVSPIDENELSDILHSWKSFTAHTIVKHDNARKKLEESWNRFNLGVDQARKVWQKESFDHIVRSPASLDNFRRYIEAHL